MLWARGLIFTLLVPVVVAGVVPAAIDEHRQVAGGLWHLGWMIVGLGATIYGLCLARFVASGGTPAVFFTRPLRALIGEEPPWLVKRGLYRLSRNPMYVGVLLAVVGQAIVFASVSIAWYAAALALMFHLVVILIEEPHLRGEHGHEYDAYCDRVPRWLGIRSRAPSRRNGA
jgi:protein-S-isoprenylcysteine O-methyltransferase Ste14